MHSDSLQRSIRRTPPVGLPVIFHFCGQQARQRPVTGDFQLLFFVSINSGI